MKIILSFLVLFCTFAIINSAPAESNVYQHLYGKPLKIMEFDKKSNETKLKNNFKAIDEMLLHPEVKDRKVVAFSIIGAYRKGKSFFLDYCLRYMYFHYKSVNTMNSFSHVDSGDWIGEFDEPLSGFSWRHGSTADTKGIIFWSDIFLHDQPNGDKIAIIIMDTQGLFELGSTHEENSRIFGLSTLISSVQIINIKDVIQEDQLEHLEMATSLTKFIAQKQQQKKEGKLQQWKPFQKLLFLVRDWSDDDVGYGYEGGKNYLETFLKVTQKSEPSAAEKVRMNIRKSFDEIDCYLLPHPGQEIRKKDFDGSWRKLDKNFVKKLTILIKSLLSPEKLFKKSILGKEVTGSQFSEFILSYFEAFNAGDLPKVENILEMMIQRDVSIIYNEQLKFYQQRMEENCNFEDENFEESLEFSNNIFKQEAMEEFLKKLEIYDENVVGKFHLNLEHEITSWFTYWKGNTLENYKKFMEIQEEMKRAKEKQERIQNNINELNEKAKIQEEELLEAERAAERSRERIRYLEAEKLKNKDSDNGALAWGLLAGLGLFIGFG